MTTLELPKLRENLSIYPEDGEKDNAKHWLVYDSIVHRFYQIGYLEYLILSLWHLKDKDKIINSLQKIYKKTVSGMHFDEFFQFLVTNKLLHNSSHTSILKGKKKKNVSFLTKFQSIYYYKIHLLRPEKVLNVLLPYCRWIFTKKFHYLMLFVICFGVTGIVQNFERYKSTFVEFLNFSDLGLWVSAVIFVKIIHEFSHAIVSKHFGCRVSSMGVAILVFWPVLFTDTTHAWSLDNRRQRILISAAGVISEIYIAAFCSILWLFIPDGTVKNVTFILSGSAWIASLFINANPFMRFDGYFVLSDILKVPNLHQAGSYYFNKYVDKYIFGIVDTKELPHINKSMRPKLAVFGFLLRIYRLLIISGILWLIYTYAFKLLAIVLMGAYILSSIILPLYIKIKHLLRVKAGSYNKKVLVRTGVLVSLLMLFVLVPWRSSIDIPAIMHFKDSSVLYADSDSVVDDIYIKEGQYVKKGDVLLVLKSQSINYDLQRVGLDAEILELNLKAASFSNEYNFKIQPILKSIDEKKSEYNSIKNKKDFLIVKAPHDGIVYLPDFNIEKNTSFKKNQELLSVVNPEEQVITGYIKEDVVDYFEESQDAIFYPENISFSVINANISNVSFVGVEQLEQPYLASVYGGDIAVKKKSGMMPGDEPELIPEKGIYSIKASVKSTKNDENQFPLIVRGTMILKSKPYSIGKSFFDFVYSGFLKYSSF